MLLLDSVLYSTLVGGGGLLRSSSMVLASEDAVEDMGEKGFRIMGV